MEKKIIAKVYLDGDDGMGFEVEGCTLNNHLNIIVGFVSAVVVRMFDQKVPAKKSSDLLNACVQQGIDYGISEIEAKIKDAAKGSKKEHLEKIMDIIKETMED